MRHFGSEMGPKSVARNFFFVLVLFGASLAFYVDSYALLGSSDNGIESSLWSRGSEQKETEWSPGPPQTDGADPEGPSQIPQQPSEGANEYEKWLKLLTFDKSKNVSEIDKGSGNESKIIVTNEKEHLEIYENNDEDEKNGNQLRENIFHLLNSENFSHLTAEGRSGDLQRSKREADDEPKNRRCRCRRVWRRTRVRRQRRRRRRNGQQNRRRRRRRRQRRRRRCNCRRRNGEEGKTDAEEPEVEGSGEPGGSGDEGGDEGGNESAEENGEGEEEGKGEGDEEEEGEEDEGDDEDSDEKSSKESGEGEDSKSKEAGQLVSPGGMIAVPPGSMVWVPGQGMPSYPNIMPPPNFMPNIGGIPVGSKP